MLQYTNEYENFIQKRDNGEKYSKPSYSPRIIYVWTYAYIVTTKIIEMVSTCIFYYYVRNEVRYSLEMSSIRLYYVS